MQAGTKERNFLTTSIRSVDPENCRITHVVNTKGLDRYDTIVLPKGADVKHFLKNPVVLWLHNMDKSTMALPIGKCVDLVVGEDEITVTTECNPNDPLSMKVFNAYKDGFLNAWSIGFMPKTFEEVTPVNLAQIKEKYNLQNLNISQKQFEDASFYGIWVISEWELLEYSAVPVPGNPEALSDEDVNKFSRELVSRGIMEDAEVRRINFRELAKKQKQVAEGKTVPAQEAAPVVPAEAPAPEAPAKPEASTAAVPEAPAATPAPAVEPAATPSPVSTAEGRQEPVPVAENAEMVALRSEVTSLSGQISELTQKNADLSARIATLEAALATNTEAVREVETLRTSLAEVKRSLEVDNIDTVRQVAQTRAKGGSADSFFSNLLK